MKNSETKDQGPDLSRSVHLSASAGSGKTRALKDRYLALLDRMDALGLNSDQAVAITFTDKAAAEIKQRVLRDLPEPMLKKIIRGRQDLRISTIHSFCMNLLKRYPLEAGLPPDFGVLDERDRAQKARQAVETALDRLGRDERVMAPLRELSADRLINDIGSLLSVRTRLKRMEIDAQGPENMLRSLSQGMELDRTEADLASLVSGSDWRSSFPRMADILRSQGANYAACHGDEHQALADAGSPSAALQPAAALGPVYFNKDGSPSKRPAITKKDFLGADRRVYEDAFFAVQDLLVRFRGLDSRLRSGRASLGLLRLYLRAEEEYQDLKLREGLLDFDDLEIYAYRLLRSQGSPEVLYWLDRKVLHFLVDEFQDTSDIQWAVLGRLTEELFSGQGADKPMAPTLFVVGDRKQSIYRFREANYRLIETLRERIGSLPPSMRDIRTLDRNYRSVPAVIGTVNQVFSRLWGSAYEPSDADRADQPGTVRLLALPPARSGEAQGNGEADLLAAEIRMFVLDNAAVGERSSDTWTRRPAGYGDCAVLLQSRTRLKEYEAALMRQGVPFRVIGGIGFYEEDEVQAVMNVLFFLWNRGDRLALAAALASPLFGLDDRDLHRLAAGGGDMLDALRGHRPEAWGIVHQWITIAGLVPLGDLVHSVIRDTAAAVRFGRRSRQAVFNLDKLLDTAREFDRRGYTTLQDFVEWVRNIRASEQREATADVSLPGDAGAVSIMTVHKAKGLEFPVVLLPAMNQQPRSVTHGPEVLIDDRGAGLRLAMRGSGNPVYDELWEQEQEELRQEHQRLLYVAMTRARDHLVMLGTLEEGQRPLKQHGWLASLKEALPSIAEGDAAPGVATEYAFPDWLPSVHPGDRGRTGTAGPSRTGAPAAIDGEQVLANISPLPASRSWEWKKATDLLAPDREWSRELPAAPGPAEVSPLTRGTVLHRCLELYAAAGAVDLAAVLEEFPEVRSLDQEARSRFSRETGALLERLLADRELSWIFRPQADAYAELPFLLRRDQEIISGVIDRVVIRDGRGYVVDYKAIAVRDTAAMQPWIDHYRPQVRAYCEAVKEMFGLKDVEGYLLFLDSGRLALTVKE